MLILLLLNRVRPSDLDDLGEKSAFSDYRAELVLADLKTKSDVTQKQYLFQCVVRGEEGVPGGRGYYNNISDLGVESAMSDFEPESFFLTLIQGQASDCIIFPP